MVSTEEYVDWAPIDEQMGLHERIRLLYVACTRARDHLVVSVHRKERAKEPEPKARTNAELLSAGMGDAVEDLPDGVDGEPMSSSRRRGTADASATLRRVGGRANGGACCGHRARRRWPPPP